VCGPDGLCKCQCFMNKICCGCAATVTINILEDSPSKPSICAQETNQGSLCMGQGILCNVLQQDEYWYDIVWATGGAHTKFTTSVHKTYSTYRHPTYRLWKYQLDLTNNNVATEQFCNNNIVRLQDSNIRGFSWINTYLQIFPQCNQLILFVRVQYFLNTVKHTF
jgi:hypothetical protein